MTGAGAPGPYATSFYFVIGVLLCAIPFNYLLMRKPLDAQRPVSMAGFATVPSRWHLWGIAGEPSGAPARSSTLWLPGRMLSARLSPTPSGRAPQ
jgi:hypothetical protein